MCTVLHFWLLNFLHFCMPQANRYFQSSVLETTRDVIHDTAKAGFCVKYAPGRQAYTVAAGGLGFVKHDDVVEQLLQGQLSFLPVRCVLDCFLACVPITACCLSPATAGLLACCLMPAAACSCCLLLPAPAAC